ncbi:glycoside hydrolase family 36 protein [Spongiimicrobium salis]|uniref:glycoside hydrolase family 36 protein n=1 Tax=Spongiimicrobium salis TaxID=1667022 RepID=UPI00374DDA5C
MLKNTMIGTDEITILGVDEKMTSKLIKSHDLDGITIYDLEFSNTTGVFSEKVTLVWKIPSINVKGIWKPTADFSKRIQADWELLPMESRISIDAPVLSIFGHDDSNVFTFACSEAIEKIEMNAQLREEDNFIYCRLSLFTESCHKDRFKAQLRLDQRAGHFSNALKRVAAWWENDIGLTPASVPAIARKPLYSTWYQFHQNLEETALLKELEMAKDMGYQSVIIDDGWQTKDDNRGYDFTGDWRPDRIPQMAAFIAKIHALDMKAALWYSVPFCGKKSEAYQRFKGKFLTENHRWAPVFDPRYPEVRAYLIGIYANALKDWNLDGFKLDFIDDFRGYEDTVPFLKNVMDYTSVNAAVDRLMTDIIQTLQGINPEIFIEFRQKYTGPAMRKYGNMFRAFDCPGDAVMNRVRIADIKMLCGNTAVHSDMVTWHKEEPVEIAALQMINTLFGVPQLSIMLQDAPSSHLAMIQFYTQYWIAHEEVLLDGDFIPFKPLANYPLKKITKNGYLILGIYDEYVATIDQKSDNIHIFNAQIAHEVILKCPEGSQMYHSEVYDCEGKIVAEENINLEKGLLRLKVPPCGMVQLKKI